VGHEVGSPAMTVVEERESSGVASRHQGN